MIVLLDSMPYTHYIIVRRDMPLGVVCAQVAHAAGESFASYVGNWNLLAQRGQATTDPTVSEQTIVVVLGVSDEKKLKKLAKRLSAENIKHVSFREPDMDNQMTAIGLYPCPREDVRHILRRFDPIQELTAGVV